MGLKATRKLLSIIFSVVISAATICALASMVLNFSVASNSFLTNHIITDEIATECESQLKAKYEVLSAESGIPSQVFCMIIEQYDIKDSLDVAANNIFGEQSADLYSAERVEYFEKLCLEYVDGNEMSYNKKDIHRTAEKATLIFSETVGAHNTGTIREYLELFRQDCSKTSSVAAVTIVVCVILLVILYSKREFAMSYFMSGLAGGGIATIFGAIICLIAGVYSNLAIEPLVYQASFASMFKLYLIYLILAGFVVVAISTLLQIYSAKHKKEKKVHHITNFNKSR